VDWVIIWINGGFGAGKTTLPEELHRRLPDAVLFDPEDVGGRPGGALVALPGAAQHDLVPGRD
jgi:hypothetical protein